MLKKFDTVFFIMSSCMLWLYKSKRICFFQLLSVERVSSHAGEEAWVKHWKSLVLPDGKSVIKDLTT